MKIGDFWNRVKKEIKGKAVTQETAAKAIGVSPGTFRGWMAKNRIPPLNYAYRLACYLGVSLDFLITGSESNKTPLVLKGSSSYAKRVKQQNE